MMRRGASDSRRGIGNARGSPVGRPNGNDGPRSCDGEVVSLGDAVGENFGCPTSCP